MKTMLETNNNVINSKLESFRQRKREVECAMALKQRLQFYIDNNEDEKVSDSSTLLIS
jgi:hypothetical protein